MDSKAEIIEIADQKLSDGTLLVDNSCYTNGCYIAGYVLELYLKAKITQVENRDDLFKVANLSSPQFEKYKTHNLYSLLKYAQLNRDLNNDRKNDKLLMPAWFYVTQQSNQSIRWSEQMRYMPPAQVSESDAKQFIKAVNKLVTWIKGKL